MVFGTFLEDRNYLISKFRNPTYPEQPGLDNEALSKAAAECEFALQTDYPEESKAACFELVCDKMFIDVNPHDFFVAFGCWKREAKPLSRMISNRILRLYDTVAA